MNNGVFKPPGGAANVAYNTQFDDVIISVAVHGHLAARIPL